MLVFDDADARPLEFDLRGDLETVQARLVAALLAAATATAAGGAPSSRRRSSRKCNHGKAKR